MGPDGATQEGEGGPDPWPWPWPGGLLGSTADLCACCLRCDP